MVRALSINRKSFLSFFENEFLSHFNSSSYFCFTQNLMNFTVWTVWAPNSLTHTFHCKSPRIFHVSYCSICWCCCCLLLLPLLLLLILTFLCTRGALLFSFIVFYIWIFSFTTEICLIFTISTFNFENNDRFRIIWIDIIILCLLFTWYSSVVADDWCGLFECSNVDVLSR